MAASRPPSRPRRSGGRPGRAGGSDGREGPRFTSRAVVLALVLLVLVISYASSLRAWLDQRQEIAETEQRIASVQDEVEALEREKRRWDDDAYVEQQARGRLGYVLPGETGYRVIGRDGDTLEAHPDTDVAATEPRHWYDTLWGSVRRAGASQ